MIVVMKPGVSEESVREMAARVESMGLKAHVIVGTERTVIAAIGEKRNGEQQTLESFETVEKVVPILAPYKVASKEVKPEKTVVTVGSLCVGSNRIGVIAGPCSVENEEQILSTARAVKAAGATALRGGAFKPRTSPYSFQGMKEDGLKLLAAAREETGLAVVTEVVASEDVELVWKIHDQISANRSERLKCAVLKSEIVWVEERKRQCSCRNISHNFVHQLVRVSLKQLKPLLIHEPTYAGL